MTTAEQLLASMAEVDRTFVIDGDLRTIKIPEGIDNLGVESDDDVLTVYFQMPGSYCGVDLSQFNIRINYLNAAEQGDYHDVDDAEVQPDGTIRFSWTIGRHAASVVGDVVFNVCLKKSDASGNVIKEFNTTTASLPILKGLEISEQVISEYNDILEQWRAKLFGVGDTEEARLLAVSQEQQQVISTQSATVLSDIELKGSETLKTIPDTYTEVYNMAEEALRTKADAIVLEAEGTVISVNDSSDDHLQNLKLYGRTTQVKTTGTQLFNPYATQNNSFGNATVENNGAKITVTGNYYVSWPISLKAGVTYHIDFKASGDSDCRAVRFEYPDKEITGTITNPASFTPTKDTVSVYLYSGLGTKGTVVYDDVMICEGSTALPWEPYTGGEPAPNPDYPQDLVSVENPSVDIYGKNLIKCDTQNISFEEAYYYHTIKTNFAPIIGETYTLSMNVNTSVVPYAINVGCGNTAFDADMNPKINAGYSENGRISITFTWLPTKEQITNGYTKLFIRIPRYAYPTVFTATVSDIMLELGSTATDYEPYKPVQSLTLNRTLHGIPVTSGGNYTDENGQQWICDEVDFDRGVYVQRVNAQTVEFFEVPYGDTFRYNALIDPIASSEFDGMVLCDILPFHKSASVGIRDVRVATTSPNKLVAWCDDRELTTGTVIYVLATPIETPLTSEEILTYKALKTNRTNTTVLNDQNARMAIAYSADTLKFLRDNQPLPTDEQVMAAIQEYADQNGVQVPSDDHIKTLAQQVAASALEIFKSNFKPAKIDVVTLPASAWVGEANPYSQVVSIEGITKHSQVDLTPDVQQLAVFHEKDITFVTENEDGVITVYAIGQKPTNDYTIQVTITEVDV